MGSALLKKDFCSSLFTVLQSTWQSRSSAPRLYCSERGIQSFDLVVQRKSTTTGKKKNEGQGLNTDWLSQYPTLQIPSSMQHHLLTQLELAQLTQFTCRSPAALTTLLASGRTLLLFTSFQRGKLFIIILLPPPPICYNFPKVGIHSKGQMRRERKTPHLFYCLKCFILCITLILKHEVQRYQEHRCLSWISAFVLDQKSNTQAKDNTKHLLLRSVICNLLWWQIQYCTWETDWIAVNALL